MQWRSEMWTSLDFKWLKRGWVAKGPDFEWDLKSGSPTIWYPDKFLSKTIWNPNKTSEFWMVWFSNGWDYSYSHSLSLTIWNPTIKKYSKCLLISDPHCNWAFLVMSYLGGVHMTTGTHNFWAGRNRFIEFPVLVSSTPNFGKAGSRLEICRRGEY